MRKNLTIFAFLVLALGLPIYGNDINPEPQALHPSGRLHSFSDIGGYSCAVICVQEGSGIRKDTVYIYIKDTYWQKRFMFKTNSVGTYPRLVEDDGLVVLFDVQGQAIINIPVKHLIEDRQLIGENMRYMRKKLQDAQKKR